MSQLLAVPKPEWRSFFDGVSRALLGRRAEIEVSSLDIGDQIVAEWVPMIGITYDSGNDLLDIALDRGNHLIRDPREVVVEHAPTGGLSSVAILDGAGARQVVRMREPLLLPPPASQPKDMRQP